MLDSLNLNPNTLDRLQAQADTDGCTIDELVDNLLEYRETAAHELREVRLNLNEATRAGKVGLWDWNIITNDASYSDEWKKILGYEPHEFEDKHSNFLAHVHPDDLPHLALSIEKTIAEARQAERVDFRVRHKDGGYRWVMATGSIVTNADGVPERLIGSIIDITSQKHTEEALRHSEARYRKVIENLNEMCVLFDADLKIVVVNQVVMAYTGLSKSELIGQESHIIFADDETHTYSQLLQKTAETHMLQGGEIVVKTLYGERSLIFKHIPILDENNQLDNIVSVTHDITEHQQIQQHEFELQLEKERGRILGEFVQDTAHEFRTPLSTIKTNTYLMKNTGLSEAHQAKVEQINLQVSRMQRLVDTLLMMTKLDSTEELSFTSVDTQLLFQRLCADIKSRYGDQLPKIICEIPNDFPPLYGDMTYLAEVFMQIADNAVRFTPVDGKIILSADIEADRLWVQIRDTGIGISADDMPNIFQTFWRQDEAHTTPGFGLGLPIAKKIIELHDGDIDITSQVGDGTTVRVILPLNPST